MNQITLTDLEEYFKSDIGPVFCTPSTDLLYRHKKFTGLIGMILPKHDKTNLVTVDWSLNKEWNSLLVMTPTMMNMKFTWDELDVIKPGEDIPQMVDEEYFWLGSPWNWKPSNRGQVVCISDARWRSFADEHPVIANSYTNLRHLTGVVVEKRFDQGQTLMIQFRKTELDTCIVNIPLAILLKLPNAFRPKEKKQTPVITTTYGPKPKFSQGNVIRISGSTDNGEQFMGLVGVVNAIHKEKATATGYCSGGGYSEFHYTINMDTLPNRCLSLCEGEGEKDITETIVVKQYGLEEWDERVSERAYLINYTRPNKRDKVWVIKYACEGEIGARGSPKRSRDVGVELCVMSKDWTTARTMTCRDVDFLWNPDALLAALEDGFVTLGIEEEKYNPNDPAIHKAYLYIFNLASDIGKRVKYKVLLGTLKTNPSRQRKLFSALKNNRVTHPWAIKRYLQQNKHGYFYQIFEVNEYIKKVGYFTRGQ